MGSEEEEEEEEENPFRMLLSEDATQEGPPNQPLRLLLHHPLPSIQSTLSIRQLPSEGLSFQLWPAATALVSLLDSRRADPSASPLSAALRGRRRILELGSGTGIVGIAAAATLPADVTLTDLPHVVPNLRFNAEANAGVVGSSGGSVSVAALRWGDAGDVAAIGREFDLIVASDVVYHDHLYEPLLETLRLMMAGGSGSEVAFLMAHMKRWKKESAFFKKARKHFNVDVLHTHTPSHPSRVGVLIYRFLPK
ncbi:hypothetical protein Fmac_014916 [Flemingia macrophylla]|uniref:Uncharacterized protein n=1 Tax=Flemingia macrophylla TaxID=520843 RepID=A0ABD1MD45_9FABA